MGGPELKICEEGFAPSIGVCSRRFLVLWLAVYVVGEGRGGVCGFRVGLERAEGFRQRDRASTTCPKTVNPEPDTRIKGFGFWG